MSTLLPPATTTVKASAAKENDDDEDDQKRIRVHRKSPWQLRTAGLGFRPYNDLLRMNVPVALAKYLAIS
jgi:hypothetical protein